jgi:hypothetical protein
VLSIASSVRSMMLFSLRNGIGDDPIARPENPTGLGQAGVC